ncbi:MAG: carbohydrate-binding protein, partial [Aeromonas sp.]
MSIFKPSLLAAAISLSLSPALISQAVAASEPFVSVTAASCASAWQTTQAYSAGATIAHAGQHWRAEWWTQGEEPGTTGEWGVWRAQGACADGSAAAPEADNEAASCDSAWLAGSVYENGAIVQHAGQTWQAQWWTNSDEPGTTGEWGVWRLATASACAEQTTPPSALPDPTPEIKPEPDDSAPSNALVELVIAQQQAMSDRLQVLRAQAQRNDGVVLKEGNRYLDVNGTHYRLNADNYVLFDMPSPDFFDETALRNIFTSFDLDWELTWYDNGVVAVNKLFGNYDYGNGCLLEYKPSQIALEAQSRVDMET